jgi:hypothetical protein
MKALVPFLILLGIIFLVIFFLMWKKATDIIKKAPRKTQPPQPAQKREPFQEPFQPSPQPSEKQETKEEKQETKEGFISLRPFVRAASTYRLTHTPLDTYYSQYAQSIQPSQELLNYVNSLPVQDANITTFGGQLGGFDAAVKTIPWDADNTDSLQKDIVWGYVSNEASKSIFIKVYHNELLSDPSNLIMYPDTPSYPLYNSPILGVKTSDPGMAVLLQLSDGMAAAVGGAAVQTAIDTINDTTSQYASKYLEAEADTRNQARAQKIKEGITFTAKEQAEHTAYNAKKSSSIELDKPATKVTEGVSLNTKIKVGLKKSANIISNVGPKVTAKLTTFMARFLPKFIAKSAIVTGAINILAATTTAGAVATMGALAPLAAIVTIIATLWNILSTVSMVAMICLSIILPSIFDDAFSEGSMCSDGKPFDVLIEDEFLYWIVVNIIPLGEIFDVFGPYLCYSSDGTINLKKPLKIPHYYSDPTLSSYKHEYVPSQNIRPDSTKFKSLEETLDQTQWKKTAGIWRKNCDPGTWTSSEVDMLCNITSYVPRTYVKGSRVPATNIKRSRVPATRVKQTYITTYYKGIGSCHDSGDVNWGLFCTAQSCTRPGNWDFVAGVCWAKCDPNTQTDVGALCRDKCDPGSEYEVLGVCWTACPQDTVDVGALCRDTCGAGDLKPYPDDIAGICWSNCGKDIDVGALCRERCKDGFHEVAGVCWGDKGTYARESKLDKSVKIYDSGYIPPAETNSLSFPVCDFASKEMLDRMAQFYYDEALLHAQLSADGTQMTYEYIIMFYGVIASSELSCDVACAIRTVNFDVLTGENYVETVGTTYPDDPGNTVSYRRFYFIYNPEEGEPKTGDVYFTVTGCTNSDYTAPDAQVKSTDQGYDVPISVPKIYEKIEKSRPEPGKSFNASSFASSLASTAVSTGLGMGLGGLGGGVVGGVVLGTVGGVAGGFAGNSLAEAISKALPQSSTNSEMTTSVVATGRDPTTGKDNYMVLTNNDHWSINHGPIYEQRARDGNGYVPQLDFCKKAITSQLLCSNQFVLRDTINSYQTQNPNKHVKTVYEIEPRGVDGCYYKWTTVTYDPSTNIEGTDVNQEAVIKKYVINDTSTCVFEPVYDANRRDVFIQDQNTINTQYPIRQYSDPITGITKYPTKTVTARATYQGRYIRIRPSQIAKDSVMQISQIAVYDPTDANIALQAVSVYATSIAAGSAPSTKIKDGILIPLSGVANVYKSSGSANDYIELDLGKNFFIGRVVYYGALDCPEDTRNNGVRIQILVTQSGTPVAEMTTASIENTQAVDFTTKILTTSIPQKPFNVPRALPPDKTLAGNCVSRCQDKPQLDAFISQYNAANSSKQILKVLRAITPKDNRCDYEVEMVSKDGTNNNIFSKELLSATASSTNSTPGAIYGRFIRFATPPNTTASLSIKQIQIYDSTNTNIARGKYVTASSSTVTSGTVVTNPAVVVDGVGTSTWASTSSSYEYLEIDLGQVQPITSVKYFGGSNDGVRMEVRYDTLNAPEDRNTFTLNGNTEQTVVFNTCSYNFTDNFTNSTFIQDTTPYLEAVDTSGGVLTFENIGKSVVNIFNAIVNPIIAQDPSAVLGATVLDAQKSASNILKSIGGNLSLQGCPNTKCSDKAVLDAIMARYNADNATATGGAQYGRETNTMKAIASSGTAGPMSCDVLFTGLYELYDDYLYPPSFTESKTMVKRFTLQNTGGCVMAVAPGSGSVIDVSGEAAVGIMSPSAGLTTPYLLESSPQIDCRNPAVLTSLKQKLAAIPAGTPTTYKSILQSFANGPNTCEYMMTKDIGTETGLSTYVTAKFSGNTLQTVAEFDPDTLTSTTDSNTGDVTYRQNGVVVDLPFLFNYDNTTPSPRVNEMVYIL